MSEELPRLKDNEKKKSKGKTKKKWRKVEERFLYFYVPPQIKIFDHFQLRHTPRFARFALSMPTCQTPTCSVAKPVSGSSQIPFDFMGPHSSIQLVYN